MAHISERPCFLLWCLQSTAWYPSASVNMLFTVVTTSPMAGETATPEAHRNSLFVPSNTKPHSPWLGGKRCIFLETSLWISGYCWAGWQSSCRLCMESLTQNSSLSGTQKPNRRAFFVVGQSDIWAHVPRGCSQLLLCLRSYTSSRFYLWVGAGFSSHQRGWDSLLWTHLCTKPLL